MVNVKENKMAKKGIGLPMAGKNLAPMAGQIFWYKWGDREFDIRQVRLAAGAAKRVYAADKNYFDRCAAFSNVYHQCVKYSASEPFEELLDRAEKLEYPADVVRENPVQTVCSEDDYPF